MKITENSLKIVLKVTIAIAAAWIIFMMSSCANSQPVNNVIKLPEPVASQVINPKETEEFGSYIRLFRAEASSRNILLNLESLRIYKVDRFNQDLEDRGVVGLCTYIGDKVVILIRMADWESYDTLQRELLVFHEMGHCVLGLPHDNSTDDSEVPTDIMYPYNFPSYYYNFRRKAFLDRLFGKVAENLNKKNPDQKLQHKTIYCQWKNVKNVTERTKNARKPHQP